MSANLGYQDTPVIPGSIYTVHDGTRPQPQIVDPGALSTNSTAGRPPSDAVILFDGGPLNNWRSKDGSLAGWKVENGYVEVFPGTGDITTVENFGDCQLHLEFASPQVVKGDSQGRGNSGIFLQGVYEVQVLDCYNNPTYADGTTGAIYGQFPPLVNACRAPGEWQTIDILWTSPIFDGETLIRAAFVTVIHNGVVLHNHVQLQGPTQHRNLASYKVHPPTGPLKLQDHGDLVRFRNIWYRPLPARHES